MKGTRVVTTVVLIALAALVTGCTGEDKQPVANSQERLEILESQVKQVRSVCLANKEKIEELEARMSEQWAQTAAPTAELPTKLEQLQEEIAALQSQLESLSNDFYALKEQMESQMQRGASPSRPNK